MGGGMSGLAAAMNLLDLGIEVEIFETDEIFGGRASSWVDTDGDLIDNALHVFFPYYVNLLAFFERLGIKDKILWKDTEFYYAQPGGKQAVLKLVNLPAPLHAIYGLAHMLKDYREVPRWKVLTSMAPFAASVFLSKDRITKLDDISMAAFVYRYASIEGMKTMEPGVNGLTFTSSNAVSAKVILNWAMKIYGSASSARVGFAKGGLGEIWVDSCLDYIREKGGRAFLNKGVTAIDVEGRKVKNVILEDSEIAEADIYVSAVSPFSLRKLLPEESFDLEYFRDLWHFQFAPSLSLQVWFDKKLTDIDCTFFANDCIFSTFADLSNVLPDIHQGGSMFEMVLSPADHITGLPDRVIFEIALEQIKSRFPGAREAVVRKYNIVRDRQGVYRPSPGMERHRPFQRSPYDNLYLTGDYTKTHVSSGGMEAAVWNSNKLAELVASDKLGKKISLNRDFEHDEPLMKYLRPATRVAAILVAASLVRKTLRLVNQ
jgi:15-cis-phytoene desaturase